MYLIIFFFYIIGDTANLIGALLTHQLTFQLYLGVYFVSIDICLLCQWTWYNKLKKTKNQEYLIIPSTEIPPPTEPSNRLFQHPAHSPLNINSNIAIHNELTPFSSSASPSKWYTLDNEVIIINNNKNQQHNTRFMGILLFASTLYLNSNGGDALTTMSSSSTTTVDGPLLELSQDNIVWIGRMFAWTCTTLYLLSRIPQLLKNRKRQSVEGLSASLFIFAVGGNLTYASSILTHPGQTLDSLLEALPYLIGSAGTLIFDFSIFCQFLWYTKPQTNDTLITNKYNTEHIV